MIVHIENFHDHFLKIWFEFKDNRFQLFDGDTLSIGTLNRHERLDSWEKENIKKFIVACDQNTNLFGPYLLWSLVQMDILESEPREVIGNIFISHGEVLISVDRTVCKDIEEIISEIKRLYDDFDIEKVFNEMLAFAQDSKSVPLDQIETFQKNFKLNKSEYIRLLS